MIGKGSDLSSLPFGLPGRNPDWGSADRPSFWFVRRLRVTLSLWRRNNVTTVGDVFFVESTYISVLFLVWWISLSRPVWSLPLPFRPCLYDGVTCHSSCWTDPVSRERSPLDEFKVLKYGWGKWILGTMSFIDKTRFTSIWDHTFTDC